MAERVACGDTASSENEPLVWVNPIPMECGVMAVGGDRTVPRFTLSHLKKLTLYARNKGKHAFPWLSYSVWQHIAKNKLNIPEEISWLYFETFDAITDVDVADRLKMMNLIRKCSNKEEVDRLRRQVCVDTLKFMLYLYVQNTQRTSLISPLATGDEWPSPERDSKSKPNTDQSHKACVETRLHDILDLLSDPGGGVVNSDGIRALEFIFLSTSAHRKHLTPLSMVLRTAGIHKASEPVAVATLEAWLRTHLTINPFGPYSMKTGARDRRCPCYRSESIGRIVSNYSLAPLGSKCTLLHGVNKQTLAKDGESLHSNAVYIQNCKASFLYLLAPLKCVVIDKCIRCVIVLGPVERCVVVSSCSGVCLISACRRLQVSSCSQSTFHLLSVTRPILVSNNHSLVLAPFNTYYPKFNEHLSQAGLVHDINHWDNPLCLSGGAASSIWSLMNPAEFNKTEIPFKMEGSTKSNPFVLPANYQQVLEERERQISSWHDLVKEAKLSPDKQVALQKAVQEKFKEWLEMTGNKREIFDLGRGTTQIKSPNQSD